MAEHAQGSGNGCGSADLAVAFHLDKDEPTALWIQLRDQVVEGIRSGALPYGSKMPTVRNLAKELGVSVSVVNQAYRFLRLTGYLEARQGSGVRVRIRQDNIKESDFPRISQLTEEYVRQCEKLGMRSVDIMDTLRFYLGWREFVQTEDAPTSSAYYDAVMSGESVADKVEASKS